eukprot:4945125-Amphidinium_carterae.1
MHVQLPFATKPINTTQSIPSDPARRTGQRLPWAKASAGLRTASCQASGGSGKQSWLRWSSGLATLHWEGWRQKRWTAMDRQTNARVSALSSAQLSWVYRLWLAACGHDISVCDDNAWRLALNCIGNFEDDKNTFTDEELNTVGGFAGAVFSAFGALLVAEVGLHGREQDG